MNRRQFSISTGLLLAGTTHWAAAQQPFAEGKHYVALPTRQPVRDPKQVEVLEFFAYSCSHCHAFEPALDDWQKKLPKDILFRRIPVAFRDDFVVHQKLYFAIEGLNLVEQLHGKVFSALHVDRQKLQTAEQIAAFASANKVDGKRLLEVMESFAVAGKVKQATQLVAGYQVEGTPSLGVAGRWLTNGTMAGSNAKSLAVAEYLAGVAKKSA